MDTDKFYFYLNLDNKAYMTTSIFQINLSLLCLSGNSYAYPA